MNKAQEQEHAVQACYFTHSFFSEDGITVGAEKPRKKEKTG